MAAIKEVALCGFVEVVAVVLGSRVEGVVVDMEDGLAVLLVGSGLGSGCN